MKGLVAAEWFKLRKRRLPWVLAACVVGIVWFLYTVLLIALSSAPPEGSLGHQLDASLRFDNVVRFGDGVVYRVTALLSLILAAVVVANEYHWRTVVLRTAWTGDRARPLAAALVVVSVMAVVALALGYVATVTAFVAIGAIRGTFGSADIGIWVMVDVLVAIVRSLPPVLLFVGGATLIATWAKSSAAGIAIPLAVLLLEPIGTAVLSAAGVLDHISPLLISRNVDALLAANGAVVGANESLPTGLPSPWVSAPLLLGYAGLMLALAGRMVARREVTD